MILETLFSMQDTEYKTFTQKLTPTVDENRVIGVRLPLLKKYAKELLKKEEYAEFLASLPHFYLEENHLHAYIISNIKDFELCISELNRFLPFVDSWSTCDSLRPLCFGKNKKALLLQIENWISSNHCYTIRFGIQMLMVHFLGEDFEVEQAKKVANVESDEYYVNMMKAWYFATALAKQWENTLPFIAEYKLDKWSHNKTIQKAIESFRITKDQKELLRKYKL